jgi:hypothetical protein
MENDKIIIPKKIYIVCLYETEFVAKSDNCIFIFSTYEKAMSYCEKNNIDFSFINCSPVDEGYIDLITKKMYNK